MVSIMWVDKIKKWDRIKGINKGAESLGVIFKTGISQGAYSVFFYTSNL